MNDPKSFTPGQRLIMVMINFIPFSHFVSIIMIVSFSWTDLGLRLLSGFAMLYLVPPLMCQFVLKIFKIREGKIAIGSFNFYLWFYSMNLQLIFSRFSFLEEIIRMFPALYSFWLRLWGSKIGKLTYWSPGTNILDRSFLDIGDNVLFGAGVRLNPHVLMENENGIMALSLGTIKIGDSAIIGGYSLITSGSEIAPGERTRAVFYSPPFSKWKNGKRIKNEIKNL